jgi:SAM-dependent methyltransferase
VAQAYARGVSLDWERFAAPYRYRKVALPTYPFQRERYWVNLKQKSEAQQERVEHWERALAAGRRQADFAPMDLRIDSFPAKWASLEQLSLKYMSQTLRQFGLYGRAGETHTATDVVAAAGIQPVYTKLMGRWLERLASAGLLEAQTGRYTARSPLSSDVAAARAVAQEAMRDYPAMFDYVELCGSKLADVLCGRESALETLFPSGSSRITDGLYQSSVVARYFNEIVRSVVQSVASGTQSLSILEIGGGTGGTTSLLLPALNAARTRYVFTDVGKLFLVQASKKFAQHAFVEYAVLDIERPPVTQGFAEHAFDVVVAANVLHATPDLATTLRNARSLLAPGGVLVMLETTDHPIWLDITTGLIEGWQKYSDPLRAAHPLLDAGQWAAMLPGCGFEAVEAFPSAQGATGILGQHVIIARVPGSAATQSAFAPGALVDARVAITARDSSSDAVSLRAQLDSAAPHLRMEMLLALVGSEVAAVLGLDAAHQPAPEQRLMEFGVDSLMAVELRNRLAQRLALTRKLTATLIFDYPTVAAIATHLATDVLEYTPSEREQPVRPVPAARPSSAAQIEELAEDQAEAMLLDKLSRL